MAGRAALACTLAVCGCLRPSEERARQDAEIGQAEVEALRAQIEGGQGVVRQLEPGYVSLWESAPRLRLQLAYSEPPPGELWIEVANCMPGAQLAAAPELPVLSGERDRSGICRFQLAPPPELRELELTIAPPESERPGRFRFAVLSDVQEAINRVQDIYTRLNAIAAEPEGLDFLLGAGDLTERGTGEQLERFQAELTQLRVPYYTTLGNHELGQNPTLFHDYFGRGSQSFEYRGVRFSLIDSASATVDPIVFGWLAQWLEAGRDQLHVVAMHIPPLDPFGVRNGAFASRSEAAKLLARLAEGGVDLTLYGHIHSYYHFDNAGIPAYISGGGGAIPERFDQIGRHFLVVEADAEAQRLDVRLVRVD
ncbi:MAG TPA: metallophosphoesterase [Polyangiaceae bacterium]|nr:metallophosphoesterase [Polyangiaceae bacterium]